MLAAKIAGTIVLVLLVLIAAVALLPDSFWKWAIRREIHAQTGRTATIAGPVHVHVFRWNPELTVEGLTIENADWARRVPLLSLRRVELTVHLPSLLHGDLIIPRLIIEQPRIDIERDASERVNFDITPAVKRKARPNKPARIPVIKQLRLRDGVLSISDAARKLRFDGSLAVEAAADSTGIGALQVHGKGTLNGKPFELELKGDPLLQVDHAHPYTFAASLHAADIKLDTHVVIPHPFDLGSMQARFDISGRDLADVYYLTALALPNTPPYQVSGTLGRNGESIRIEDFHGRLGGSDIAGLVKVDMTHDRPKLEAKLTSKQLRLADLGAPLGTQAPMAEQSTIKPNASPKTQKAPPAAGTDADSALLMPDADLQVDRVRAMDADVTLDASSVLTAKMPVQKLSFHLVLDNGRLTLDPLAFTLPQGQFGGSVAIDARGAVPQTDLDMKLSNVDMAHLMPKGSSAPPLQGELLGRIRLHGTGTSVHKTAATASGDLTLVVPHGEVPAAYAELTGIDLRGLGLFLTKKDARTEIRCGAANLHAEHGDFKATRMLFDTTDVLITGSGHMEMQSERLDFALRGEPKKMRLVRLRAPITLKGTLLHPKVGVDAGHALAQAGGAAALGAVLTPFAAVLAFVDRGLAKNADCAAVLAQAGDNVDRTTH
jgi:hypothetical protein